MPYIYSCPEGTPTEYVDAREAYLQSRARVIEENWEEIEAEEREHKHMNFLQKKAEREREELEAAGRELREQGWHLGKRRAVK
jgi:hypothetical protein